MEQKRIKNIALQQVRARKKDCLCFLDFLISVAFEKDIYDFS